MTYLEQLETKVLLERLVIGLEEPVLVKGLGELQAKIDSGNGGYNVIHGSDFHQQGDTLMFSTVDNFGHPKKISAKVIDTIEVNMGGGNIENRPVIELDIKFAGEDYKKIPFSVSDRSTNTHPILISKGFVEKELEALIDVGAKNISTDGIDVVYGEGVGNAIVKTAGDIKRGMQTFGNAYNNTIGGLTNFGKWLKGDAKMSDWTPSAQGVKDTMKQMAMGAISAVGLRSVYKFAARLKNGMSLNSEDPKKIVSRIKSMEDLQKFFVNNQSEAQTLYSDGKNNSSQTKPVAIFNFSFQKGEVGSKNYVKGMENQAKKWKDAISKAKEGVESRKKDQHDKDLNDQAEGNRQTQADLEDYKNNSEQYKKFKKWSEQENGNSGTITSTEGKPQQAVNASFIYPTDSEYVLTESLLILEDDGQPNQDQHNQPTQPNQPENTQTNTEQEQQQDNNNELTDAEIQSIEADFPKLCEFILWYCPLASTKQTGNTEQQKTPNTEDKKQKNESVSFDMDTIHNFLFEDVEQPQQNENNKKQSKLGNYNQINKQVQEIAFKNDKLFAGIYATNENVSPSTMQPIIKTLAKQLKETNDRNLSGVFCLAYAKSPQNPTNRDYHFFIDEASIVSFTNDNVVKSKEDEQIQKQEFVQKLDKKIDTSNYADINDIQFNNTHDVVDDSNPIVKTISSNYASFFHKTNSAINNLIGTSGEDLQSILKYINKIAKEEYSNFVTSQLTKEYPILKQLTNFTWTSKQDFIDQCFNNETIRNEINTPQEESEEDTWINDKLHHLSTKGII